MKYKIDRFTDEDFEDATQVERIYMTMMQPNDFALTDRDFLYSEVLNRAYPIVCSLRPYAEKIRLILEIERGKWQNQAVQIYNDAQALYGRFDDINPKILRGVLVERMRLIADKMASLSDIKEDAGYDDKEVTAMAKAAEVERRALETIAKIHNLHKTDEQLVHTMPPPPRPMLPIHPMYLQNIEKGEIVE